MAGSVTAVVVHYRGGRPFLRCLESCLADEGVGEVVVVDNEGVGAALRRGLPDPRVRVLQLAANLGFGGAANVGLASARNRAALVMNQDAALTRGSVSRMIAAGQRSGAWVVGPRLVGPEGVEALPKSRFPPPLTWRAPPASRGSWRYAPWVSGAAMLFMPGHTDLRFDGRLFMYAEDEELCWRVWSSGGRVARAEDAVVIHEGGTATRTRWSGMAITGRTVLNRARFVRWHGGWRASAAYMGRATLAAVGKRLGGPGG